MIEYVWASVITVDIVLSLALDYWRRRHVHALQRENAELILRLDAIDAAAITAGVTLRDLRTELNEAVGGSLTGDDMSVFIETAMKAVHDRLLLLERAREDNKGPVQARGVVASRRAIMEMGGAKDLM